MATLLASALVQAHYGSGGGAWYKSTARRQVVKLPESESFLAVLCQMEQGNWFHLPLFQNVDALISALTIFIRPRQSRQTKYN